MKYRLDKIVVQKGLADTRSRAENLIRLNRVSINGKVISKPGYFVNDTDNIKIIKNIKYVSRAGLKLESVAKQLKINFSDRVVLDVGSSTGGFTDFALQKGAKKVIGVDVGTDQMHPSLRTNPKVELHEKTDIRDFVTNEKIDIALIDVSFISIREILPAVGKLCNKDSIIIAMVKPQFEAGKNGTHNGVVKNNNYRRQIFKSFEDWCREHNFYIVMKQDSSIKGQKGNQERFYKIKTV